MSTRTKTARTSGGGQGRRFPILPVAIGVAAVALIATVLLTFEGETRQDSFGNPTVTGERLLPFASASADPSVGQPAPEVLGADFEGNPVAMTNDGRAKMIVFLAHWCPFCQNEVPVIQRWLDAGSKPEGVDVYAVSTSMDSLRTNYPPSAWLENENWTSPVIVDDEISTVAASFGLNAFPFWVFVAADGTIWGRTSGEIGAAVMDDIARALVEG